MGLVPDDPARVIEENVSQSLEALVGAPANRPVALSYWGMLDTVIDQAQTNACVGCWLGTSVYLCGQASGRPVHRPSEKAIYDGARLGDEDPPSLVDWGCRPTDAIEMARKKGLVKRASWPLFTDDPELLRLAVNANGDRVDWINAKPPFDIYHEAADALLVGYARGDTGDIIGQLEQALVAYQIPGFAMHIEEGYERVVGRDVYDTPSAHPPLGSPTHMQAICGYDDEAFEVVSSWGTGHGAGGLVRVRKNVIASAWSFSRMVVTSVPLSLRVAQ